MSHNTGNIHDKEYDEHYIPDELQCESCTNEALVDGLCGDCHSVKVEHQVPRTAESKKEMQAKSIAAETLNSLSTILEPRDMRKVERINSIIVSIIKRGL